MSHINLLKVRSILIFLIVLMLVPKVIAKLETMQKSKQEASTKDSMTWPMLPGESLNQLAEKFYPKNKKMQRQFVFKTQRLAQEALLNLKPDDQFKTPTAIVIPTLASLSMAAKSAKPIAAQSKKGILLLSYNLQSELKRLPKSLVIKNDFLLKIKAKLNSNIIFLKKKLHDSKQTFRHTFSPIQNASSQKAIPKKTVTKHAKAKQPASKKVSKPKVITPKNTKKIAANNVNLFNKLLWIGIVLLSLLTFLGLWLFKKFRISEFLQHKHTMTFNGAGQKTTLEETVQAAALSVAEMDTEEKTNYSVINKAKALVNKNGTEEAIEYLKSTIKSEPKSAINIWLYLLALLREQNLKEDFGKLSAEIHDKFNVMTPLWEKRQEAAVIPESLEELPHILEKISKTWPRKSARTYLSELVNDDGTGEQIGFSQSVLDEILLLMQVLDRRNGHKGIKGSI